MEKNVHHEMDKSPSDKQPTLNPIVLPLSRQKSSKLLGESSPSLPAEAPGRARQNGRGLVWGSSQMACPALAHYRQSGPRTNYLNKQEQDKGKTGEL